MGGHWRALAAAVVVAGIATPLAVLASSRPADSPDVVISEVMTSNKSTIFDTDGESADWIELWNRSSATVDLTGWWLSDEDDDQDDDDQDDDDQDDDDQDDDDQDDDDGWPFPRLSLEAGDRMVIFASGKADRHRLHADFRLSGAGEYLGLKNASGRTVSEYRDLPALGFDISYGLGSDDNIGVLTTPTPGLANSPVKPLAAAKPILSRTGGYIEGPVLIGATTATEDAQLWYTTDGSTPTTGHGTHYRGPISIDRTTTLRIVATRAGLGDSFVASATFLVMTEVLAQSGTPPGWSTAPVNGQVYQFGFDQQYIDRHRARVAAALQAAPILSITTDLDNLIDPESGLYSNASQSGSPWERPASIELIDGEEGFQLNGGIRIKGGFSRGPTNPKHSFRLTFGNQYEGQLNYPLFGAAGPDTFASVDLRTEQNYAWSNGFDHDTMMRDHFTRDTQSALGDPSTRSRWVHLFLDGQYWGLYMLRDDITASHARQLWGGSINDYDVIKHSNEFGYEVADGDDDEWLAMWAAISDGVLTDDEFSMIAAGADLANLADFMLVNIYVGNIDAVPTSYFSERQANNWQAVRGPGQRFRFFIDDAEHTLGALDHNARINRAQDFPILGANPDWSAINFNPGWLHQVLTTRSEYREIVRDRATELLAADAPLGTSASLARWRALRDAMDPLVEAEVARWGYAGIQEFGTAKWEAEVDWVQTVFLPRRTAVVWEQLITGRLLVGSVVTDFPQH